MEKLSEQILKKKRINMTLAWTHVMTREEIRHEVAQLEAEIAKLNYIELPNEKASNVFEAYLAWKSKAVALQKQVKRLREGSVIAKEYGPIGAPEVHRAWRDVMLSQARNVGVERMVWKNLPTQDKQLDEQIASAIVEDFLVWFFAHKALEAGGDDSCSCCKRTPDEAKGGYKCSTCGLGGER